MVGSHIRLHDWLELAVMLFQVLGVLTLLMTRLLVNTRWSGRMRLVFMVAMLGLGICGAWCGQNDSEFGLFAGGTMTALLIGMTIGAGSSTAADDVPIQPRVSRRRGAVRTAGA